MPSNAGLTLCVFSVSSPLYLTNLIINWNFQNWLYLHAISIYTVCTLLFWYFLLYNSFLWLYLLDLRSHMFLQPLRGKKKEGKVSHIHVFGCRLSQSYETQGFIFPWPFLFLVEKWAISNNLICTIEILSHLFLSGKWCFANFLSLYK